MDNRVRKYEKFVFKQGFAIVQEKPDTTDSWFPYVTFFEDDGVHDIFLYEDAMKSLYKHLEPLGHINNNNPKEGIITEFVHDRKTYRIFWENDEIVIYEHSYDKDDKEQNIVKIVVAKYQVFNLLNSFNRLA